MKMEAQNCRELCFCVIVVVTVLGFAHFCIGDDHVFKYHGQAEKPLCKSNAHVCTSIMRYPDGSEFDEGPYCECPGCSSKWVPDDFKSLSWSHFERADKMIQYKFCNPILPERWCDSDDLAVTISTSTGEWSPYIREARCTCPGHTYELLGWWRHPTPKMDNKTGVWIYEYFCGKEECVNKKMPCSKKYIDPYNKHSNGEPVIVGYNFLCACPKGYKCPDTEEDEIHKTQTDFRGKYIPRFCEPVHTGGDNQ